MAEAFHHLGVIGQLFPHIAYLVSGVIHKARAFVECPVIVDGVVCRTDGGTGAEFRFRMNAETSFQQRLVGLHEDIIPTFDALFVEGCPLSTRIDGLDGREFNLIDGIRAKTDRYKLVEEVGDPLYSLISEAAAETKRQHVFTFYEVIDYGAVGLPSSPSQEAAFINTVVSRKMAAIMTMPVRKME